MFLLLSSFFAGMLTSLAPCMLTLLPVIVGNAVLPGSNKKLDRWKPYVITASLAVSVVIFTLLLKASTVLINVAPGFWLYLSGGIVILLGISMLLPNMWAQISAKLGFEHSSNSLLAKANKRSGLIGQILTGAALGPVFASCSPVYALILATVLPINIALGMVYIVAFALGLGIALLLIALGGQKVVQKVGWAANPYGWFRRGLAIILIVVGFAIIGGYDKKFQTWAIETLPFDITDIEKKLIPESDSPSPSNSTTQLKTFNVTDPYQAPEIRSIQSWVNSEPLALEGLRGKVVLIDFWTYSCINCKRTQPYLNAWHDKYNQDGLVIVGVHAPEFAFEKVTKNVQKAVLDAKIKYPVALDNDFQTWQAYKNQYWPAKYLIDKNGLVRYTHFGEGEYEETETAIQALLQETGTRITQSLTSESKSSSAGRSQTPETYLSYTRGERFANADMFKPNKSVSYTLAQNLTSNQWTLGGDWNIGKESVFSGANAQLKISYNAREVYLVMSGTNGARVKVSLEGTANPGGADVTDDGYVALDSARLYTIVSTRVFMKNALLTLSFPPGVTVNAFTFGA